MIQFDPSRRPNAKTLQELQDENRGNAFWCGPMPWHECPCGSSTFEITEFGRPLRCTKCHIEFLDLGTDAA